MIKDSKLFLMSDLLVKRFLFLAILGLCFSSTVHAQSAFNFPVQIQTTVFPPYSPYVDDYSGIGRMQVRVVLSDPLKPSLRVKLGLSVKSADNAISYQVSPNFASVQMLELDLERNKPILLDASQIRTLFQSANILVTGNINDPNSPNNPNNLFKLPEAQYYISVVAVEASDVNLPVSNPFLGFSSVWVQYAKPPLLNLPLSGAEIEALPVQNIMFQWTPLHLQTYIPTNSGVLQYQFQLIDLNYDPNNIITDPKNAFANNQALINTNLANQRGGMVIVNATVPFPYYQLTQADLPLIPNHNYAWRVTLREANGDPALGKTYIAGNGESEVFTFTYKKVCAAPLMPKASIDPNNGNILLNWYLANSPQPDDPNRITAYNIVLKPANGVGTELTYNYQPTNPSQEYQIVLNQLPSATAIEVKKPYQIYINALCTANPSKVVYAGEQSYIPKTCEEGPKQIVVSDAAENGITSPSKKLVTWEFMPSAQFYTIKTNAGQLVSEEAGKIYANNFTFEPLPNVTYQLFATCSNGIKAGGTFTNNNGYQGTECKAPAAVDLKVLLGSSLPNTNFTLTWAGSNIYQKYDFSYQPKATATQAPYANVSTNLSQPTLSLMLERSTAYSYSITYHCSASLSATVIGNFTPDNFLPPPVITRTADCFPPVNLISEVKSNTSVELAWDRVVGADEYTLYYILKANQNSPEAQWQKKDKLSKNRFTLSELNPNAEYVYYVKVSCGGLSSIASRTAEFNLNKPSDVNGECAKVIDLSLFSVANTELQLNWTKASAHINYQLRYRNIADPVTIWYTLPNTAITLPNAPETKVLAKITNLQANTTYEIELTPYCIADPNKPGPKSELASFSTTPLPPNTAGDFACGKADSDTQFDLSTCGQKKPKAGISFMAAGFQIIAISEVKGKCLIPYANFAEAELDFQNVTLDANNRFCGGKIIVRAITLPALQDVAKQLEKFQNEMNKTIGIANDVIDVADNALDEANKYFAGGNDVGKVKDGQGPEATGSSTVTTNNGTITINNGTTNTAIGKLVDKTTYTPTNTAPNTLPPAYTSDLSKGKVTFSKHPDNNTFAFDEWKSQYVGKQVVEKEYELLPNSNTSDKYRVPIQFCQPNIPVKVSVSFSAGLDKTKIKFINNPKAGDKVVEYNFDGISTLTLAGGKAGDAQEIYAVYVDGDTKYTLGKLLLPSYPAKALNLVLIPVKNALPTDTYEKEIKKQLDKVYGQIGVTFTVTTASTYTSMDWDLDEDDKLQDSNSPAFSNDYTGEERAIVQNYISTLANQTPDPNTAYLFILPEPAVGTSADLLGKMPHQEQFGFIFAGTGSSGVLKPAADIASTAAHELGHGVFMLDHPFIDYIGFEAMGITSNVMDNPAGIELWKFQWDRIHDPGHVWGAFQRDKDALLVSGATNWLNTFFQIVRNHNMKNDFTTQITPFTSGGTDYLDRILVFENMSLGGKIYHKIVVDVPPANSKINAKVNMNGNTQPEQAGFDNYLSIGDFKITVLKDNVKFYGTNYKKSINTWNSQYNSKLFQSNLNDLTILADYLTKRQDNLLLFVNGYRTPDAMLKKLKLNSDNEDSDNTITTYDRYNYWNNPDLNNSYPFANNKFMEMIGTTNAAYADGHHKIYTSNHWVDANNNNQMDDDDIYESKKKFLIGLIKSTCAKDGDKASLGALITSPPVSLTLSLCASCYHDNSCVILSTTPNIKGYNLRYEKGMDAGKNLWDAIKAGSIPLKLDASGDKIIGKIDIVAHSMGYAYAQGMVDVLKQHLPEGAQLGRFYILMPENPCSATTFNQSIFEEVWQYGSHETEDPLWEQDGVAPQCAVPGLSFKTVGGSKYGRIPNKTAPVSKRNFLDSHSYFDWIFNRLKGSPGYVSPR